MNNWLKKKKKSDIVSTKPSVALQKNSIKDTIRINLLPIIFLSYSLVIILIFSVVLSGGISIGQTQNQPTTTNDTPRFVGTWSYGDSEESFNQDGSYKVDTYPVGTWSVQNGKFSITYGTSTTIIEYTYVFSNNDNTLTLTGVTSGTTKVYTR